MLSRTDLRTDLKIDLRSISFKRSQYERGINIMSLLRFDPSTVTVKQSFIVRKIVGCPVILEVSFACVRQLVVLSVPVTVDFDSVAFVLRW